jgi:hypothetical protein
LLGKILTTENLSEVLAAASGKGKRAVEELVVQYAPRPDAGVAAESPRARDGGYRHRGKRTIPISSKRRACARPACAPNLGAFPARGGHAAGPEPL